MKRFLLISIAIILMLVLVGCGQSTDADVAAGTVTGSTAVGEGHGHTSASEVPNMLEFSSLEDFLHSFLAAGDGRSRGEFLGEYSASRTDETLADVLASVDVLSLENFYLPVNIPENYRLFRISIFENEIGVWYLPEEHLGSEWDAQMAMINGWYFLLHIPRGEIETPVEIVITNQMRHHGITEDHIIDGAFLYLSFNNSFRWVYNNKLLTLQMPQPLPQIIGFADDPPPQDPLDLIHFTEVFVLDMTDEEAILEFLESLEEDAPPPYHPPSTYSRPSRKKPRATPRLWGLRSVQLSLASL